MANKNIVKITKSINKKGRLKGSNKKETKILNGICTHHKINKHGKIKPTTFVNADEYCICKICGAKFPARFYDNDALDDIIDGMKELNNQNKYTSVAINSGDKMTDFFCTFGAMLTTYKKNSKKIREVARKRGDIKKKKDKSRGGSSMYGSWGTTR